MKVSIISPVYNSAPYIGGFLDSVAAQTLSDFELILVDDHGTDGSMAVALEYVARSPLAGRVRFLQTPANGGPGAARNVGLAAASGDYVAFVDSDDRICPEMLSEMTACADAIGADICYCHLRYAGGRKDGQVDCNPEVPDGEFTAESKRAFLVRFKTFCVTFIYNRDFLCSFGLKFPEERSCEDTNFLVKTLLSSRRIALIQKPFYQYCIHGSSLTSSADENRYLSRLSSMGSLMDDLRSRSLYAPFKQELDFIYLKKAFLVGCVDYLVSSADPRPDVLKSIGEELDRQVPDWSSNSCLRRDAKLVILCRLLHSRSRLILPLQKVAARIASEA